MIMHVEELEISLGKDWLYQFSGSEVYVDYDYEAEEIGRYYGPPEDCYPGYPAHIDINSIKTLEEFVFVNEHGVKVIFPKSSEISQFFTENKIELMIEEMHEKIKSEIEDSRYYD